MLPARAVMGRVEFYALWSVQEAPRQLIRWEMGDPRQILQPDTPHVYQYIPPARIYTPI